MSLAGLSNFERLFDRATAPVFLVLGFALTFGVLALGA